MYPDETVYENIDSFGMKDLDKLEKLLEGLQSVAPNIRWVEKWEEHENLAGEILSYVSLEVPVEQSDDAIKIYESYKEELDEIENDLLDSKYMKHPQIFWKNADEWEFTKEIGDFIDLFSYLGYILGFSTSTPVIDTLKSFAQTLSEIYEKAWQLPEIEIDTGYKLSVVIQEEVEIYKKSQMIEAYINYHIDLKTISTSMKELLHELTNISYFNDYYYNNCLSPDEVAAMIAEWKQTFENSNGWGERLVHLLLLLHTSIGQINNGPEW